MIIGLLKEIKKYEYRVGLTPESAHEYVLHGHTIIVEKLAGENVGFHNSNFEELGCKITTKQEIYDKAELIIKVKEPLEEEYKYLHEGQILYTFLHLAANKKLTEFLLNKKVTSIAYETVMERDGTLPLLKPMSEIAGRLSVQEGMKYLEKQYGGRGVLVSGVPGIKRGKITIIGGGIVGRNACKIAVGVGAEVTVLDISPRKLEYLDNIFGNSITTLYSTNKNLEKSISETDIVIGAVLIPGAAAPKLIKRKHLKQMKKGAVIVDVAIDQGGCVETSKKTHHSSPIFITDGIVHYCVTNMPSAVALSSTYALTSVTNKFGLIIANNGIEKALRISEPIRKGLNTYQGKLTNKAVADNLGFPYEDTFANQN